MDYLPGNPWVTDTKERLLEINRDIRVRKHKQWIQAEDVIYEFIQSKDIWDLCDNKRCYIFNHKTNRFIIDNEINRNRIINYRDYIELIHLRFYSTTGYYSFNKHEHIPDKALYELLTYDLNLIIEVDSRKRYTYSWEYTKEERLLHVIDSLNTIIVDTTLLKNIYLEQLSTKEDNLKKIKNLINVQLEVFEEIASRINEGHYLQLMNTLKGMYNLCN